MKTRIISLLLAIVMMFGCISFGAFATDENAAGVGATSVETINLPTANGIMSVDAVKSHADVEDICSTDITKSEKYGFTSKTDNPASGMIQLCEEEVAGVKNYYLKYGAPTATVASYDSYLTASNAKAKDYATADANVTEYGGKSFVVSLDIKILNAQNLKNQVIFNIRSIYRKDKVNSSLTNHVGSINKDGYFVAINEKAPISTSEFTTVAVFVEPKSNTCSYYVDGVLLESGLQFMPTGTVSNVGAAGSMDSYMPSQVRMLHDMAGYSGDAFAFDNFKFYYADYYVECAEHKFVSAEAHTHDAATGTLGSTTYICESCSLDITGCLPLDENGDGKCDTCVSATKAHDSYHSIEEMVNYVTAKGGEIVAYDDAETKY